MEMVAAGVASTVAAGDVKLPQYHRHSPAVQSCPSWRRRRVVSLINTINFLPIISVSTSAYCRLPVVAAAPRHPPRRLRWFGAGEADRPEHGRAEIVWRPQQHSAAQVRSVVSAVSK